MVKPHPRVRRGRAAELRTDRERRGKAGHDEMRHGALRQGEVREGEARPGIRRRWGWLTGALLAALTTMCIVNPPENARAEQPSLDEIEAAYLYNFGKFVRWPDGPGHGPMLICVAGEVRFRETVSRLVAGEQISGRALEVREMDHPEDAGICSILFVGTGEQAHLEAFLAATMGKPVLTVGDEPDFLERGGIIQFLQVGDHVRFEANLNAANRNRLSLSSELLKVAVSVTGKPGTGGVR